MTFTGSECFDWAGGVTGEQYAAQGNILLGGETVDALAKAYEETEGDLAARLSRQNGPRVHQGAGVS